MQGMFYYSLPLNIHWKDWHWAGISILWPPDVKSWLIGKDPDAGKDRRQEKGTTEDKMVEDITDSMDVSLSKLWEIVKDREAWCFHSVAKSCTQLSDWTMNNNKRCRNWGSGSLSNFFFLRLYTWDMGESWFGQNALCFRVSAGGRELKL